MAKQEKLEESAAKAYDHAKKAVKKARKAAKKLESEEVKRRVEGLDERLSKVRVPAADEDASQTEVQHEPQPDSVPEGSLPLPNVTDATAEFVGSTATSAGHDPDLDHLTVQALRDVARTRGMRNVSHLTKAQLIERLSGES
jgi:flagellar basal body rod protein FlgC